MAIYPDYTSIGILVVNSEHDISNRMREEARLASSNIIVSDEISLYDDLTRFLVYLKQQKTLRHLREKEALRKEIGEDMEKELSKKMMDELREMYIELKRMHLEQRKLILDQGERYDFYFFYVFVFLFILLFISLFILFLLLSK